MTNPKAAHTPHSTTSLAWDPSLKMDRYCLSTPKLIAIALLTGVVVTAILGFMSYQGIHLPYTTGGAYACAFATSLALFVLGILSFCRSKKVVNSDDFVIPKYYNLVNESEIAPSAFQGKGMDFLGFRQLPYMGAYNPYSGYTPSHCLGVRLPKEFLANFAIPFTSDEIIEAFFLVFQETETQSSDRNIVLHGMAFPDYNIASPDKKLEETNPFLIEDFRKNPIEWGVETTMQIGIFDPKGIKPYTDEEKRAIPFGKMGKQRIQIHGKPNGFPRLSPDEAKFTIEKDAHGCSFFVKAKFCGKIVAFHAVIVRDNSLDKALKTNSLPKFLKEVKRSSFPCRDQILQTFTDLSKQIASSHE